MNDKLIIFGEGGSKFTLALHAKRIFCFLIPSGLSLLIEKWSAFWYFRNFHIEWCGPYSSRLFSTNQHTLVLTGNWIGSQRNGISRNEIIYKQSTWMVGLINPRCMCNTRMHQTHITGFSHTGNCFLFQFLYIKTSIPEKKYLDKYYKRSTMRDHKDLFGNLFRAFLVTNHKYWGGPDNTCKILPKPTQ